MADAQEAAEIKDAFKKVDQKGDGSIARADLGRLFQELAEWSQEDLDELFDALDAERKGWIPYADFVDWVMADDGEDESAAPPAGVDEADDSDNDDDGISDRLEGELAREGLALDLARRISCEECVLVMRQLGEDGDDAREMYNRVVAEVQERGESAAGGVPLREFLDDLQIEPEDGDGLKALARAVAGAAEKAAAGLGGEAAPESALPAAIDKVVCVLDKARRPAQDAWAVISEGKVPFSRAQQAAVDRFAGKQAELIEKVHSCMISPPMLPPSAGQEGCRERCEVAVDAIIKKCRAAGAKFTDPEWDVHESPRAVLYVDKEKPGFDCTVGEPAAWKRLTEIVEHPVLFKQGVTPCDIEQGQIGTCFLLGAIGAIAGKSDNAIRKVFIKYDTAVGVYGVRFNLDGEWMHVVVDDYMPVDSSGRMLYAHSKDPSEVWCPLLEKAYCKMHTCYEMCDGGRPSEAVFSFFGGASGKFVIQDKHRKDPKTYFHIMQHALGSGWLLTTSFVKTKGLKAKGKCGEDMLPTGLVGGHVYSVLKLVEAHGEMLVCCRNPWGTGEWKGKWSDKNAHGEWTEQMKAATGYLGHNDGKFWMSIGDFVAASAGAEYARTFGPNWRKLTHYRRFQRGPMRATAQWPYKASGDDEVSFEKGSALEVSGLNPGWWYGNVVGSSEKGYFPGNYVKLDERPVARFDLVGTPDAGLQGPMTAVVLLMQPNVMRARRFYKRHQDGLNYKDTTYASLQLCVLGPDGKVAFKKEAKRRCLSGELTLPGGGLWKIYALSSDGRGGDFTLRVYVKDGSATLKEVPGANLAEVAAAVT